MKQKKLPGILSLVSVGIALLTGVFKVVIEVIGIVPHFGHIRPMEYVYPALIVLPMFIAPALMLVGVLISLKGKANVLFPIGAIVFMISFIANVITFSPLNFVIGVVVILLGLAAVAADGFIRPGTRLIGLIGSGLYLAGAIYVCVLDIMSLSRMFLYGLNVWDIIRSVGGSIAYCVLIVFVGAGSLLYALFRQPRKAAVPKKRPAAQPQRSQPQRNQPQPSRPMPNQNQRYQRPQSQTQRFQPPQNRPQAEPAPQKQPEPNQAPQNHTQRFAPQQSRPQGYQPQQNRPQGYQPPQNRNQGYQPAPNQNQRYQAPPSANHKYQPPVAETPKYEPPVVEAPKYEPPVVETPKYEPPVVETPKYEPPVVETPKYEPPVVETPKYEPPVAETPKYEPPVVEAPNYPAPPNNNQKYEPYVPEVPKYEPPVEEAPKYEEPKYEAPQTYQSPGDELASKLIELRERWDKGVITQREYAAEKQRLLDTYR